MSKTSARPVIRLRGVRHNNLKNFDLDLPLNQLIVITGLSGSGKSSLAFDTLFAEGQRRYIETFSPYARQFFDRMDKPQVDSIEGIPPAIAIEQRNSVKTTRSTVGTMTEICDYMKILWPHIAQLHCRQCGQTVQKDTPQQIWETLENKARTPFRAATTPVSGTNSENTERGKSTDGLEVLITFDLPLSEKLSLAESAALVSRQGYQRILLEGRLAPIEEFEAHFMRHESSTAHPPKFLTVVQDRLRVARANRARFIEACEQALHFGKGKLTIWDMESAAILSPPRRFSKRLHCAQCDIEYREPTPALFSFNHPLGACPTCRGFGRVISIDYNLAIPDQSRTLSQGVVKPWLTGQGAESQVDLMRACRRHGVPTDVPFEKLPKKWQDFVIEGEPGHGADPEHQWPRSWYGIKGYFRWLESKAYKMHVRVLLSRYRAYTPCPDCQGRRFQPEALLYRCDVAIPEPKTRNVAPQVGGARTNSLTLADFYQLPIREALQLTEALAQRRRLRPGDPLGLALNEVRSRLGYLQDVGLGYLTLDRPTRSLSGGETERVNLTTCLGTRLVNTLFVLDEPSVGLHPRDTERLVRIVEQLRDAGNTVLVVEHEASVMRAADQIVDLGPGHGATGGNVVFQGNYAEILEARQSLTGQYLSGRKRVEVPSRRTVEITRLGRERTEPGRKPGAGATLTLSNATLHNLKDLTVEIPLGRFVCVTGVSGSGKTTLVREVLLPALAAHFASTKPAVKASDRLESPVNGEANTEDDPPSGSTRLAAINGAEHLASVVLVDQSILSKTPRSNPALYIGAFDEIREFFAQSEPAKQRGLDAGAFSFNSSQGQCERCRGAGFEKIEMQFLSDVFVRCPDCQGRRYRSHILEVKISPTSADRPEIKNQPRMLSGQETKIKNSPALSIADLLEATVEEAVDFLSAFPASRPAQRAQQSLRLLEEVGLGYLKLGQPINTLSGGESQRLKLVRHLSDAVAGMDRRANPGAAAIFSLSSTKGGEGRGEEAWASRTRYPSPQPCPRSSGGRGTTAGPTFASEGLPVLFLFDEPTTGLHFDDVRVLLKVFQRLVDAGHSVVVIEHNLDVIKCADWVIDLGPDAGDQGGQIVAEGTPEEVAACPESHTGRALRQVLKKGKRVGSLRTAARVSN